MERNAGHCLYPQVFHGLRSKFVRGMKDPGNPRFLSSTNHGSGHVDAGNSFLAHLYGPPSLLQLDTDFQELSDRKFCTSYSNCTAASGNFVVNSTEGGTFQPSSGGLITEDLNNHKMQSWVDTFPDISSRAVVGPSSCSSRSNTAARPTVPGVGKARELFSSRGQCCGTSPTSSVNAYCSDVQTTSSIALEQCSSKQAFPFTSGCPLVFCMGKSGYLLLSNTGLLGIVCSCHCCHMSVLKFCEHSGLYGADPGDAVRMESGETIAQWQKLYFLKFQIRSQGNESEWDWPEALSTTRSLMKSNASAQSSTSASDLSHVLSSSAVILRKRPPTVQDGCDISLKGFTGISQDNLYGQVNSQLMESNLAMYTTAPKLVGTGADNDCQPLPPFPNSRKRNENLSIAHAPSQTATSFLKHHEFIINKNAKHGLVGRVAASSNIGLKHGQLPKKGYPVSSFIEPLLFNALVTPPKSQPPKQMINQLDKEEDFSCAAGSFKMVEELPQLELRNYMSGVSNSLGADKGRSEIDNVPKGLYFSPFPQFNPQPEGKSKSSENLVNDDGLIMPKKLHSEFSPTQFGSTNVLWNNIVHTGRQLDNSANKILDNNRGARFTKDSSDTINTAFGISQLMEYPSSIPGPVSGSYNGKIYESHHESSLPTNTSVDANFLHATEKVSLPLGQDNQVISEAVIPFEVNTKGFPFLVSSYTSNQNPTFLQQRSINMDTSLLDENMRLLALTQILELSKQQHALYLHEMNQKQGRFSNISKVQHCIYDASASEQGTSGATLELPQNGGICGNLEVTCDSGKLSSLAGLNRHCCRSALAQPLHSKEKESHCTSYDLRSEEPSLSLGTNKDNNRSSECAKFTEQPSDLHYAAQANGSGSNFFSGIGASHYTSKQQYANASGETSLKIASKYSRDENILKNVNIHFEQDVILDGQDSIKISSDSPRWRDVPNKTGKEVCDATPSLDQAGTILGSELQDGVQLGNISAKRLKRTIDIEDLLKEQENSNVSSGCSAPVVTQASAEVNKVDSCSADAGDTSCVNNLVLDEMSGIDKSWSSDAVESGRSAGLLGSTSKSYLKKGYLQVLNDQACHSILDEHKLLDSPTCKKGQDQNNITLSINRSANQAQKIKKGSKGKKRKRKEVRILDASLSSGIPFVLRNKNGESTGVFNSPSSLSKEMQMYSSYSQKRLAISASFVEPSTKLRNSTFLSKIFSSKNHLGKRHSNKEDICESESNSNAEFHALPEVFGRKKLRKDITSNFFGHFQMQESAWQEPENANPKLFSGGMTNSLRITKPVVCGKYGEICSGQLSGDVPKPAKLVSLSKVLESCKRCTVPSNGKTRLISKRNWKRPSFGANYGCCSGQPDLKTEEENKPKYKVTCNETNFDVSIEGWERGKKRLVIYKAKKDTEAKLHGSIVNRVDAPLKLKSKGIRKQRSIYELTANGVNDEKVGFYGTCVLHAMNLVDKMGRVEEKEITCARTEGYKGRKRDGFLHNCYGTSKTKNGCLVPEEQLNAWVHINGQKPCSQGLPKIPASDVEHDCRKEYARYKQAKGWRHLVVYKSGIHGLGLYTSLFISRGAMVVEYVGEIVGLRVSDKRENEYQSGRKLQYKSACYFFKIDKEHIIDATRKGGIARFVNHSCLPNCVAKVITVRHEKKVVFFAERDILPGEEITYDYHFNHEDEGKKIPCYCNSKNCRRYLN